MLTACSSAGTCYFVQKDLKKVHGGKGRICGRGTFGLIMEEKRQNRGGVVQNWCSGWEIRCRDAAHSKAQTTFVKKSQAPTPKLSGQASNSDKSRAGFQRNFKHQTSSFKKAPSTKLQSGKTESWDDRIVGKFLVRFRPAHRP